MGKLVTQKNGMSFTKDVCVLAPGSGVQQQTWTVNLRAARLSTG